MTTTIAASSKTTTDSVCNSLNSHEGILANSTTYCDDARQIAVKLASARSDFQKSNFISTIADVVSAGAEVAGLFIGTEQASAKKDPILASTVKVYNSTSNVVVYPEIDLGESEHCRSTHSIGHLLPNGSDDLTFLVKGSEGAKSMVCCLNFYLTNGNASNILRLFITGTGRFNGNKLPSVQWMADSNKHQLKRDGKQGCIGPCLAEIPLEKTEESETTIWMVIDPVFVPTDKDFRDNFTSRIVFYEVTKKS